MKRFAILAFAIAVSGCMPENEKARGVLKGDENLPKAEVSIEFVDAGPEETVGAGPYAEKASEGGVLVVVTYKVTNTGKLPVGPDQIPAIQIYDPAGTAYSSDLGRTAAFMTEPNEAQVDAKAWSDLNPGITTRGAAVFEVSRVAYQAGGWTVGWVGGQDRWNLPSQ